MITKVINLDLNLVGLISATLALPHLAAPRELWSFLYLSYEVQFNTGGQAYCQRVQALNEMPIHPEIHGRWIQWL